MGDESWVEFNVNMLLWDSNICSKSLNQYHIGFQKQRAKPHVKHKTVIVSSSQKLCYLGSKRTTRDEVHCLDCFHSTSNIATLGYPFYNGNYIESKASIHPEGIPRRVVLEVLK
jgi:hypothetical protein